MTAPAYLYSDLILATEKGELRLPDSVHPLPDLLERDAESVLEAFKESQQRDFLAVVEAIEQPDSFLRQQLQGWQAMDPAFADAWAVRPGALRALFLDLHAHVMEHPVWRHPFFVRFFKGEFDLAAARRFAVQYHNQIKNTRQCVAMAIGRFHSLADGAYPIIGERISEVTQSVLAQLVADEYGVVGESLDTYPTLQDQFQARTHIALYRSLLEGLEIAPIEQNQPLLHGVADNVLTQRLLAGDEAFTPLEALASVGLGMEWGVPEFFSLLLGGLIRWGHTQQQPLAQHHLEVLIAHVRYDVLHAIAVMLATSLHIRSESDVEAVKGATNALMAARYGMMTDMYGLVFGTPCPSLADIDPATRYRLTDRRLEERLPRARRQVSRENVVAAEAYTGSDLPYVFA